MTESVLHTCPRGIAPNLFHHVLVLALGLTQKTLRLFYFYLHTKHRLLFLFYQRFVRALPRFLQKLSVSLACTLLLVIKIAFMKPDLRRAGVILCIFNTHCLFFFSLHHDGWLSSLNAIYNSQLVYAFCCSFSH